PLFTRGWRLWLGHELVPERIPVSDRRVSAYPGDRSVAAPSRKPDPSCRRSSSLLRCRLVDGHFCVCALHGYVLLKPTLCCCCCTGMCCVGILAFTDTPAAVSVRSNSV